MKTYRPDWDISTIPDELILSRAGSINAARRETRAGGRPITKRTRQAAATRKRTRAYYARKAEAG